MIKKLLLAGAIIVGSSVSYSQESVDLKAQILQKETALKNATTASRQMNNDLKNELQKLYSEYQLQLENEIRDITDEKLISTKREELENVKQKIQSYSQQK